MQLSGSSSVVRLKELDLIKETDKIRYLGKQYLANIIAYGYSNSYKLTSSKVAILKLEKPMTHISPMTREDLPEMEPMFKMVEAGMGFVPTSMFTMAHWPELLNAFGGMGSTVLNTGEVEAGLKQLIAYVVSNAAGCQYCQAHTSHNAEKRGVQPEKVRQAFEFETSTLFSEKERSALRLALHAGMVPNATEPSHFDTLKQHFSDRQIVEIVAVISLFGFLNRWNDTMATSLESQPAEFASNNLSNWEIGKHG